MHIQWSTKTEQPRNRQQPAITRHNKQNGKLLKKKTKIKLQYEGQHVVSSFIHVLPWRLHYCYYFFTKLGKISLEKSRKGHIKSILDLCPTGQHKVFLWLFVHLLIYEKSVLYTGFCISIRSEMSSSRIICTVKESHFEMRNALKTDNIS